MYNNKGYDRSKSPSWEARTYKRYRFPGDEDGSDSVFHTPRGHNKSQDLSRQPDIVNNLNSPPARPPLPDEIRSPGSYNNLEASVDLSPSGRSDLHHTEATSPFHDVSASRMVKNDMSFDQNRNKSSGRTPSMSFRARWERNRNITAQHYRDTSDSTGGTNRSGSSSTRQQPATVRTPNVADRSFDVEGVVAPRSPVVVTPMSPPKSYIYANLDSLQTPGNQSIVDSKHSARVANESHVSRDDSVFGSLRRDPVTHKILPNGSTRLVKDQLNHSRRSLDLSRLSLNKIPKLTLYGRDYGVYNSLVSLAIQAVISLVFCFLGMQLLLRLSQRAAPGLASSDSILRTNESYNSVMHVTVAFSSIVVMLNLCCVLTCSMQFYFATKLVKCPQGEERAFKYLKECTGTRFIAVTGSFISVVVFFFALLLFILMEYSATAAIITTVVFTVGLSFSISMIIHSVYFWRAEKNKADENIAPFRDRNQKGTLSMSELSTLV